MPSMAMSAGQAVNLPTSASGIVAYCSAADDGAQRREAEEDRTQLAKEPERVDWPRDFSTLVVANHRDPLEEEEAAYGGEKSKERNGTDVHEIFPDYEKILANNPFGRGCTGLSKCFAPLYALMGLCSNSLSSMPASK